MPQPAVLGLAAIAAAHDEQLDRRVFPDAIVGGTYDTTDNRTIEQVLGTDNYEHYDYSIYPKFDGSIGFTQRGCRLKCGFCVVPKKEGAAREEQSIADLWRGEPYPRQILLLDNDFFGVPAWRTRVDELRAGAFRVCFSQGINARMISDEAAKALEATITLGTAEQWNACQCLNDAASRLHSAAAWLARHDEKHHPVSRPESVR